MILSHRFYKAMVLMPVSNFSFFFFSSRIKSIYCLVPARWGLQQTTLAPDSDKTQAQGSFGPLTGGRNLTPTGEPPTCGVTQRMYAKYLDRANLVTNYQNLNKASRSLWVHPYCLKQKPRKVLPRREDIQIYYHIEKKFNLSWSEPTSKWLIDGQLPDL